METSFKAALFDSANRVLLGSNPRGEWELLGGRADQLTAARKTQSGANSARRPE
jgi:hypothetical protein